MTVGATGEARLSVEGQRFAIVPEWVIDSDISDTAFRLYAVLLRYGQTSGQRMPSRATLSRRLRKRSVDTVDRAMRELVCLGAVVVERRREGRQNLTNLYHVRTSAPGRADAATGTGTRTAAATPGRSGAAAVGRAGAATPAAPVRPDREPSTESTPPPTYDEVVLRCRQLRDSLGLPSAQWAEWGVRRAVQRALQRGWPTEAVGPALLAVAADPESRSPMRLAEAGPWWDAAAAPAQATPEDLGQLEEELDALDGARVHVQRLARQQLRDEGLPLTKSLVIRRAVELARAGLAPSATAPAARTRG